MGLEEVAEDVKEEAKEKAEAIKKEAEKEREKKIEQANEEAEQIIEQAEQDIEKEIQEMKETKLSGARLDARRVESKTRKQALENTKEEAQNEIEKLEENREELTRKLLQDALDEIDEAKAKVYSSEKDEDLVKEILEEMEAEYAGIQDIKGGVIVEVRDGKVRIDNSFDSFFEEIWQEELKSISSILFDESR